MSDFNLLAQLKAERDMITAELVAIEGATDLANPPDDLLIRYAPKFGMLAAVNDLIARIERGGVCVASLRWPC